MRTKNKICLFLLILSYGLGHRYQVSQKDKQDLPKKVVLAEEKMAKSDKDEVAQDKFISKDASNFMESLSEYNFYSKESESQDIYQKLTGGNQELPQINLFTPGSGWGFTSVEPPRMFKTY